MQPSLTRRLRPPLTEPAPVRVLIVKLSSLGDVLHAAPVVHDIRAHFPGAQVDWVVEPAFAPLLRRVQGMGEVIECAQRRWRKAWWTREVRAEWRAFRKQLTAQTYDAVLDLQGLTKSALLAHLANGPSFGFANQTEGSAYERPVRWLVDQAVHIESHTHALDRSRALAAVALNYEIQGPPRFGLHEQVRHSKSAASVVFVHGTSRDDKLWPESHWIELGRRCVDEGLTVLLPHAGAAELERAKRLALAIGEKATVWPAMSLDTLVECMAATHGVVGVDSGLSHIAVALNLPHVQIYNFFTAWRTAPQVAHGHSHQVSIERVPTPSVDEVWAAWQGVRMAAPS